MLPCKNTVLQHNNINGVCQRIRILRIERQGAEVFTCDIDDKNALPIFCSGQELESEITNSFYQVLEKDPFDYLSYAEEDIPEHHKQVRDRNFNMFRPLIEQHPVDILLPEYRAKLVEEFLLVNKSSRPTIYKYLRKYWQRGQTPNAFLPDYYNCGGRGKEKPTTNKRFGRHKNKLNDNEPPPGIIITEEVLKKLIQGINKYWGNGPNQSKYFSIAYRRTLETFFAIKSQTTSEGSKPVLPPIEQLPTLRQARYWYNKYLSTEKRIVKKKGQKFYFLRGRPITGDSTLMAKWGPGVLFQIDATIGDIYLVSSIDPRRIIGRPVIYMVIDVFSRMIVGFHVSLEGPSWTGARLALENVMSDKVSFCKKYGINIQEEQWPVHYLPDAFLADRGELASAKADQLPNSLGIQILNTAPYRADLKGIIESAIHSINEGLIHTLPGAVLKLRERGDPEYWKYANLTLDKFRKCIIHYILHHNNFHYIEEHLPDIFMIADQIPSIPLDIWNWGIINRSGILREKAPQQLHIDLLPRDTASISDRGIIFRNLHYDCELAHNESWYTLARNYHRRKINIAYDPRSVNTIYFIDERDRQSRECTLLEKDNKYKDLDWDEIKELAKRNKEFANQNIHRELQSEAEFYASIDAIVKPAHKEVTELTKGINKSVRRKDIRSNRREERQMERRLASRPLDDKTDTSSIENNSADENDEEYVPQPSYADEILRNYMERFGNEQDQ